MTLHAVVAITVAVLTIAGMLARPWRTPEWLWAVMGGAAELVFGGVDVGGAWVSVRGGANVYAFLIGVLALAELARTQGVFAWLAGHADAFAGGSRLRLLVLVYGVGAALTATLSNDTTVIVLTPAALALGRRIGGSPLPYLFACAFVANAASFLLPTGNPANLLLFGNDLPALWPWLAAYAPAAVAAIVVTFVVLALHARADLSRPCASQDARPRSTPRIRLAFGLLAASAAALVIASALGLSLGATALVCAVVSVIAFTVVDRSAAADVARHTSWGVVPLVAGLLVIVAALESAGTVGVARAALERAALLPPLLANEVTGIGTALLANVANNLPVAVFAARALHTTMLHPLAGAVLVGTDLGPNLSLSGSLATLLWLVVLRREGITVRPGQFLARGAIVLFPALIIALIIVR